MKYGISVFTIVVLLVMLNTGCASILRDNTNINYQKCIVSFEWFGNVYHPYPQCYLYCGVEITNREVVYYYAEILPSEMRKVIEIISSKGLEISHKSFDSQYIAEVYSENRKFIAELGNDKTTFKLFEDILIVLPENKRKGIIAILSEISHLKNVDK